MRAWSESRRIIPSSILAELMKEVYLAEVRSGSGRSFRKCFKSVVTEAISWWNAAGFRKSTWLESTSITSVL
jgi:hypothetical protein